MVFFGICFVKFRDSFAQKDYFGIFVLWWNLEEGSYGRVILEASFVQIVSSLEGNDHFASFFCEIRRKPRMNR